MPGVSRQAKPQRPAYAASHIPGHPGGVQAGPRPEHPGPWSVTSPAPDDWSPAPAVIWPSWKIADAAIVANTADNSQQIADSSSTGLEDVLSQLQRDSPAESIAALRAG
jgi:hypothetical protein